MKDAPFQPGVVELAGVEVIEQISDGVRADRDVRYRVRWLCHDGEGTLTHDQIKTKINYRRTNCKHCALRSNAKRMATYRSKNRLIGGQIDPEDYGIPQPDWLPPPSVIRSQRKTI